MSYGVNCCGVFSMPVRSLAALVLLLVGTAAGAETLGHITASIDGGAEKTWFVTAVDGQSQSSWVQVMPGSLNMSSASLWGNTTEDEVGSVNDALLLNVALVRQPAGMAGLGTVQYLETGFRNFWSSEENAATVTIADLSADGDLLTISGSFEAEVTLRLDASGTAADPPQRKSVAGTFEVTVSK
jgi:hypothetical protein